MAPYRIPLRNRHRLVSSYLFLITCVLDHATAPTTGNPQQQQLSATTTSQVSNTKPRINVSKLCEPTSIHVTVRTSRPFFGLIHAKDKRRSPACVTEGLGQQMFSMQFEYVAPEVESYCGLVVQPVPIQQQASKGDTGALDRRIMSLILVIRLHKTIESSEDQFFLLSCASTSPLSLTNASHKSDCANSRPSNQSVRDEQIEEAYYKLITSHQIANRWTDSLLSHTPQLQLRYQWLVHISCTLAALLAITLCIALWLCGTRNSGIHNKKTSRELTSKQILYNSSQSSNKSTQSTDGNSSSSDEMIHSSMPVAIAPHPNNRQHVASVHTLKRPTRLNLDAKVDYHEAQGQPLINTFNPEQAVNYFTSNHCSLANPYQNFRDICYKPTLEETQAAPPLDSISLMKQQVITTNTLATDAHMYRLQSKSNPSISQFNPQDSRQLLGLIQQKQLQQIPQQGNMGANQI